MLAVYRLIALFAGPLALAWLRWRAAGPAALRAQWRERLGAVPEFVRPCIWIHAASVGEVNAAVTLTNAILDRFPNHQVVISTFTATGRLRADQVFGQRVVTVFAPLDTSGAVKRWLDRIKPEFGIIIETELWPELFVQCRRRDLPIVLANARLSTSAMKQYRRFRRLYSRTLESIHIAACRTDTDAGRFLELGMPDERIRVTGNLKFDMPIPENIGAQAHELRQRWGERPAWVAGSTRPGEEAIIIAAHQSLIAQHSGALLVLAPRHPERSEEIGQLLDEAGLKHQPIDETIDPDTPVILVDRLGMLLPCYAAASAAFVGGSLVDIGGHNLLEPAAFGKAVIAGPHLHQQSDMAEALDQAGALIQVDNHDELAAAVNGIWNNPQAALERGRASLQVIENGRGSVRRTLKLVEKLISAAAD